MPARHYRVEYTEDDANYTLLSADEAPGPGKTAQLTGLASGTHTGKLRLTPLTGDATPVLSLPFTFQVGTLGIAEPVQAAATATATIADVMTLRDNLLAAIGVQATSASTFSGGDQLTASATVTASAADQRIMAEQLVAAVSAQASTTDLQAMAEQLLVAIAGTPSVLDVQPGLTVEPLLTAVTAQTTAADVQAMAEHLVAAATAQGTQADGLTMHDNVSAAATATATIADVKAMLESVLAAATAQATVTDSVEAASTAISFETDFTPYTASGSVVRDNTVAYYGTWSAKIPGAASGGRVNTLSRTITAPASGTKTVERWFRVSGVPANGGTATIAGALDPAGPGAWWGYLVAAWGGDANYNGSNVPMNGRVGVYTTGYGTVPLTVDPLTAGVWYRVVVVLNFTAKTYTVALYDAVGTAVPRPATYFDETEADDLALPTVFDFPHDFSGASFKDIMDTNNAGTGFSLYVDKIDNGGL